MEVHAVAAAAPVGQGDAGHQVLPADDVEDVFIALLGRLEGSALLGGDLEGLSDLIHRNGLAALLLGRRAVALSAELTPLLQQEASPQRSRTGRWRSTP